MPFRRRLIYPLAMPLHPQAALAIQRAGDLPTDLSPAELRIGQTRFFSFALPPGWRIGEDGQFALTLLSPDNRAMTVMVGNSGLPMNVVAGQFAYNKLSAMQPQNLQMSAGRPARPTGDRRTSRPVRREREPRRRALRLRS